MEGGPKSRGTLFGPPYLRPPAQSAETRGGEGTDAAYQSDDANGPRHAASGASQRGMSGCDRTPHRSDVSDSPTRACERMRAACARTGYGQMHRRKTGSRLGTRALEELAGQNIRSRTNGWFGGACVPATMCLEGRRHGKWRLTYTRAHCEFETQGEKTFGPGGPTFGMTHVEPDWPPEPGVKEGRASFTTPHRVGGRRGGGGA